MSLDKDCCLETYSEAFRKGKTVEQERIIKVIEDSVGRMTADVIIKQIKGEHK